MSKFRALSPTHSLTPLALLVIALLFVIVTMENRAFAQPQPMVLDESCTVTIGNQTSPVRVDGSFIVPNIFIINKVWIVIFL